jgi:hypothetical protein
LVRFGVRNENRKRGRERNRWGDVKGRGERERQTERERERQTERERERETERERERQTERDRERQTERERETDRKRQRETDRKRERETDRKRQRDRLKERERQTERERETERGRGEREKKGKWWEERESESGNEHWCFVDGVSRKRGRAACLLRLLRQLLGKLFLVLSNLGFSRFCGFPLHPFNLLQPHQLLFDAQHSLLELPFVSSELLKASVLLGKARFSGLFLSPEHVHLLAVLSFSNFCGILGLPHSRNLFLHL